MKRWTPLAALSGAMALGVFWLWVQVAALDAIVRGGDGPPSLVLLHGYGSNAGDWLQFEHKLQVPGNGRMVFPQGPLRGPKGSRGWWWLNIEGHTPRDPLGPRSGPCGNTMRPLPGTCSLCSNCSQSPAFEP